MKSVQFLDLNLQVVQKQIECQEQKMFSLVANGELLPVLVCYRFDKCKSLLGKFENVVTNGSKYARFKFEEKSD